MAGSQEMAHWYETGVPKSRARMVAETVSPTLPVEEVVEYAIVGSCALAAEGKQSKHAHAHAAESKAFIKRTGLGVAGRQTRYRGLVTKSASWYDGIVYRKTATEGFSSGVNESTASVEPGGIRLAVRRRPDRENSSALPPVCEAGKDT